MQAVLDAPQTKQTATERIKDLGGKYLTFRLDNEEYGVEILKVREIIGLMDITKVPQTPDFVEGVINLRGKVIPVIDLRSKFGLDRTEYNEQTCIIVDTVSEVNDIPSASIEPAPQLGSMVDTSFILGMGKVKDEVKILLDIDKVLTTEELVNIQEMAAA